MSKPLEICFAADRGDRLEFRVLGRTHPESTDYWDGNWLTITGKISLGVFQANVKGDIRVEELRAFLADLETMQNELKGSAKFVTMEVWLEIALEMNKLGQFVLSGFVKNGVWGENKLNFVAYADQTFLNEPIKQIRQVLEYFPILGDPKRGH